MTILAVARDNRWLTGIAAPEHCRSTIQTQMTFLRVRAVAVEAFRGEKWFDLSVKADVINGIYAGGRDEQQEEDAVNRFHMS